MSLPSKWQLWLVINPLSITIFYVVARGLDLTESFDIISEFFMLYGIFWLVVIPLLMVYHKHRRSINARNRKGDLYNTVLNEIKNFVPFRKYKTEEPYQIDLARHLEERFGNVRIELTRSSTRPDIIVGNDLAIEVKGPTCDNDLQTIADKCMRYPQYFKKGLIVALFDVHVNNKRYDDWLFGMKKHFPYIKVVKNENAK